MTSCLYHCHVKCCCCASPCLCLHRSTSCLSESTALTFLSLPPSMSLLFSNVLHLVSNQHFPSVSLYYQGPCYYCVIFIRVFYLSDSSPWSLLFRRFCIIESPIFCRRYPTQDTLTEAYRHHTANSLTIKKPKNMKSTIFFQDVVVSAADILRQFLHGFDATIV